MSKTVNELVIPTAFDIYFEDIMSCNQEETDTRLILDIFEAFRNGYKKLSMESSDTDTVIIALYHFFDLDIIEVWTKYGVGQQKRWPPIHEYANSLEKEICRVLTFRYRITGSDTVSAFSC